MSLSSMTGFARCEGVLAEWTWAVEARSVNGRNLDIRFRGPPAFDGLERVAREAAQASFQRGQITVILQGRRAASAGNAKINLEVIERYLALCEPMVAAGRAATPSMDGLLGLPGVMDAQAAEDEPGQRAAVEAAMTVSIRQALEALNEARREEGAALARVLGEFLDRLETLIADADGKAAGQPALMKDRYALRLTEMAGEAASAERIVQEAAAMALKADVREELDRLGGHVAAARALLAQDGASGRRLDFLTQEFMREANTLCAKSASASLTAVGLDLKATIDQFREQVQNVE